ncbi:MAG: hypothetical protein KDK39_16035 [Leptospiraceae bacterium]|nr:hypothetical protein [Leptospiraceae bacterium]
MRKIILFALILGFVSTPLFAYKTKWEDKNYDNAPAEFKLDGVIFSGYEFTDYQSNGAPDSSGPSSEKTGFKVGRAYLNFRGKVTDGNFKGWGFRITTDLAPAGVQGDGCATAPCAEDNDYNVFVKYALVTIPTPVDGLSFILGQQHVPGVDGKAGVSLQEFWDHRYVEKTATEYLGMSSSTDRGLAMVYNNPFFGLHLLLGNGEGYHHNNAEGVSSGITSLSTLAKGSSDASKSYGLDLYGMPSVTPTGDQEDIVFSIGFPFRLQNIWGIESDTEMKTTQVDITSTSPTYTQYVGDARSKRDYSYGVEGNLAIKQGDFEFGIGGGSIIMVDKRTNAYKVDQSFTPAVNLNPATADKFDDYVYLDQDQKGFANYIQLSVKYMDVEVFGRYIIATSRTSLGTKMGTSSSKSWEQQMLEKDASNGTLGDLGYLDAVSAYDNGKAKTRIYTLGIEYHLTKTFRVAAGITEYWGDNPSTGKHFKKNPLSRITNSSGTTLDSQLESSATAKQLITGNSSGSFESDDLIGNRDRQTQTYIRTMFAF